MNADHESKLRAFIDAATKDLPPSPAPASLERSVLDLIQAREAKPWWRKSFVHWPRLARLGFLGFTTALAAATVWAFLMPSGAGSAVQPRDFLSTAFARWREFQTACAEAMTVLGSIMPESLVVGAQAALGVILVSYVILLAAGTAAYRQLWRSA